MPCTGFYVNFGCPKLNGRLIGVCDKDRRVKFADRWKTRKDDPPCLAKPHRKDGGSVLSSVLNSSPLSHTLKMSKINLKTL